MPKIIVKSPSTFPAGGVPLQSEEHFICVGTSGVVEPSLTQSTVTTDVTYVPNDGTTEFTVSVQLRDAAGNIVPAQHGVVTVYVAPSGAGHVTLGAVSYIGLGLYQATGTAGTVQETAVISAKLDGDSLTDTASVGVGVFDPPDIFGPDDLVGVTWDSATGHFLRAGVPMGLIGWTGYDTYAIVDHPLGGGKSIECEYGWASNFNIGHHTPVDLAFGEDIWVAGKFYFHGRDWDQSPGQDGAGGKLEQYLAPFAGGAQWVMCYSAQVTPPVTTTKLGWYLLVNDAYKVSENWCTADEDFEHWGRRICSIDQQIEYDYIRHFKMNSGWGVEDGVCEFWIDGVRVFWIDNVPWYRTNNGKTITSQMAIGDQFNVHPHRSAKRNWREILVSTTRPR